MARRIKGERALIQTDLDTKSMIQDGTIKPNKRDGFVFIRKELQGEVPLYELDFINKIKVVKEYLDNITGRTARKIEAKQAKISDRMSTLEVTGYNFIADKAAPRLTSKTKKVGLQLDSKYEAVTGSLIIKSSVNSYDLNVLDVNPNYLKYCSHIPILATIERTQTDEI